MKSPIRFMAISLIVMCVSAACTPEPSEEYGVDDSRAKDMANESSDSGDSATINGSVFFKNLQEGDTVSSPVHIKMGMKGMKLKPAGQVKEGVGHHHLVVDGSFIKKGTVIPSNKTSIHYGNAQTQADVKLKPGLHVLTLQFGDGMHRSYGEALSQSIEVFVKGGKGKKGTSKDSSDTGKSGKKSNSSSGRSGTSM